MEKNGFSSGGAEMNTEGWREASRVSGVEKAHGRLLRSTGQDGVE